MNRHELCINYDSAVLIDLLLSKNKTKQQVWDCASEQHATTTNTFQKVIKWNEMNTMATNKKQ